jgi:hypothetical protein
MTYIIEGIWSGYGSGRDKLAHREYTDDAERAEKCKQMHSIRFTDGTVLYLKVYEERLPAMNGYGDLISDCIRQGVKSVAELR